MSNPRKRIAPGSEGDDGISNDGKELGKREGGREGWREEGRGGMIRLDLSLQLLCLGVAACVCKISLSYKNRIV